MLTHCSSLLVCKSHRLKADSSELGPETKVLRHCHLLSNNPEIMCWLPALDAARLRLAANGRTDSLAVHLLRVAARRMVSGSERLQRRTRSGSQLQCGAPLELRCT